MNCLLLLIILFCCNSNGGSNNVRCNHGNYSVRNYNTDDYRNDHVCEKHNTPPPCRTGTQFPYLDVEPRTCGCEEKSDKES